MAKQVFINLHESGESPIETALIIALEVDCMYDPGSFYEPFSFRPETEEEHAKLISLLDEYGMAIVSGR